MAEEERQSGEAQLEKEVAWDPPWTEVLMGKSPFPSTSEQPSYTPARRGAPAGVMDVQLSDAAAVARPD